MNDASRQTDPREEGRSHMNSNGSQELGPTPGDQLRAEAPEIDLTDVDVSMIGNDALCDYYTDFDEWLENNTLEGVDDDIDAGTPDR